MDKKQLERRLGPRLLHRGSDFGREYRTRLFLHWISREAPLCFLPASDMH